MLDSLDSVAAALTAGLSNAMHTGIHRAGGLLLVMVLCVLPWEVQAQKAARQVPMVLLNVSGAEFSEGVWPGENGTHYFFPDDNYFDQWQARGIRAIRFPLRWERLQTNLWEELDETYAALIDRMLIQAERRRIKVTLDVHNFGRYKNEVLGSKAVPIPAYRDLLHRVSARWRDFRALHAYDIMNEPHDEADEHWPRAAQAGIFAIRGNDWHRPIIIEGRSWSSATRWPQHNDALLDLKDPSNNLIFSAHLYFDEDASGRYQKTLGRQFDPDIAVKRVKPFVEWLEKHGKRGQIGEAGFPADDPRWGQAMDRLLAYLQERCVPLAYWSAGSAWGDYPLSIEPVGGRDRPQWPVLAKYLTTPHCTMPRR
ncbi:glycoside hydrolase family 5 protein [Pseudomonas sp. DWP3-1-2]|uniref:glycoside hydrolase family 5 protein n=1 Tax=Pseudomonas sp. DWP3-1-2 TaxID=2804645 RepID=UPI003CE689CC